jgi:Nucleotidyl transferase
VSNKVIILAGGKGSRLGPYTTVLPKPLMPIGDRAILDVVVHQLRSYGFTDLIFAVGYLAHLIQAVFGDGSKHDVTIEYHMEEEPLGTAGALGTIEGLDETFLAMNRGRPHNARLRPPVRCAPPLRYRARGVKHSKPPRSARIAWDAPRATSPGISSSAAE